MAFDMDDSLGFILNKTALLSKTSLNTKIKEFDISPEQWSLVYRVVQRSGLTQKELSDSTYKDQANITRSIDRLIQKELIKRVSNDNDRRSFRLYPTDKAVALVERIAPISKAHNEYLTKGLSEQEAAALKVLLKKIYENLEQEI